MIEARIPFFYRIIKPITVIAMRTYFSRIEFQGLENVPKDKPFILAANHQNAFLDPFLAGAFVPVPLFYLTRSDIFNKRTTPILRLFNMLPIYRMRDGVDSIQMNEEVFKACAKLFSNKMSVMIFAEGNHGEAYYLRPLKKGASRIALGAQSKLEEELYVVPCGHRVPRTKSLVVFEKAIPIKPYMKEYEENPQKALVELRDEIADGMRKCLVIPEDSPDYTQKAQEVYDLKNQKYSFQELRKMAEEDYASVPLKAEKPIGLFKKLLVGLFSIPNFLPLLILFRVIKMFKDKVFWGSLKYGVMLIFMPIWFLILFFTGLGIWNWQIGLGFVGLSLLSLFVRAELQKR